MLLGFIIIYLLFTLAIGWWASQKVKTTKDFVIGTIDHKHMPVVSLENLSNFGKARQGQLLAFATDIYFDEVGNRTVAIKLNPKRGFLCFFRQGEDLVPERAGFPRSRQAVASLSPCSAACRNHLAAS